jgi:hypothetical protein
MTRAFGLLAVLCFGVIFTGLVTGYEERQAVSSLAAHYLTAVPADLGAPNVVTGILITYRGFDTLGEVAVLSWSRPASECFSPAIREKGRLRRAAAGGSQANWSATAPRWCCR